MLTAQAKNANNVFWKSELWKRCLVHDIFMLPRKDMYKPPASKLATTTHFTDIQERKQVT